MSRNYIVYNFVNNILYIDVGTDNTCYTLLRCHDKGDTWEQLSKLGGMSRLYHCMSIIPNLELLWVCYGWNLWCSGPSSPRTSTCHGPWRCGLAVLCWLLLWRLLPWGCECRTFSDLGLRWQFAVGTVPVSWSRWLVCWSYVGIPACSLPWWLWICISASCRVFSQLLGIGKRVSLDPESLKTWLWARFVQSGQACSTLLQNFKAQLMLDA